MDPIHTYEVIQSQTKQSRIVFAILLVILIILLIVWMFEPALEQQLLNTAYAFFIIFFLIGAACHYYFTELQPIELYNDKIVVKNVDPAIIFFTDIRKYSSYYGKGTFYINIRLKDGSEKVLGANRNRGLEDLYNTFDAKMKEQTR